MGHLDFPAYQSHEIAKEWGCFQCCTRMEDQPSEESGYPPGHGAFKIKCPACGATTFYDIEEGL